MDQDKASSVHIICTGRFINRMAAVQPFLNSSAGRHDHDSIAGHSHSHDLQQDENGVWTCSMHPQIRQDKPGKCPICAMDLIPVRKSNHGDENVDPSAIQLSEEAMALADVQTSRVNKENPVKQVRLYGKIAPDERSLQSQTAHVGGRIENLAVDFTPDRHLPPCTLPNCLPPRKNCWKH